MRAAPFRTAMLRLALAAIVLLATLPTLGRLAERGAASADGGGWVAMCTSAGLSYLRLPGLPAALDPALRGAAPGMPAHPHDADCDYCPLLASLVAVALWLAFAPHCDPRRLPVAVLRARRRPAACRPCGLGSRGPPLAL